MGYTVTDITKTNSYVLANGVALLFAYAVFIPLCRLITSVTFLSSHAMASRRKKVLCISECYRPVECCIGLVLQVNGLLGSYVFCFPSLLLRPAQLLPRLAHTLICHSNAHILLHQPMGRITQCLVIYVLLLPRELLHMDRSWIDRCILLVIPQQCAEWYE